MTTEKRPITVEDLYRIRYVEDPRFSPDGRWIAYVVLEPDRLENSYRRNIWLIPAGGGEPVQVTRSNKDSQPRWSPDGSTLAFISGRDKKPQIYLLRVTVPGGEARQLTRMPNGVKHPAWSPDGKQIAFLSPMNAAGRASEDQGEEEMPPADSLEARHRSERSEHDETQRWDPRIIKRIPYREGTSYLDDRYDQVYVMAIGGDAPEPHRLTNLDTRYYNPQWTPDGQYVLTARSAQPEQDLAHQWNSLYRLRVSDGSEECLTDDSHSDSLPLPSPDGRWIAYLRDVRTSPAEHITRLAVISAEGGEPSDLNLTLDRGADAEHYRWTADSSAVIFSAASEGERGIYRASLADGSVMALIGGPFEVTAFDVDGNGSIAFARSTAADPSELMLQRREAASPQPLVQVNRAFLEEVIVQPVHEMPFQAEDGRELQGWYLLPVGHEPGQQHPLILNIHGGPFAMWGPATQSMWHEFQIMAASGYAVFYCNPRGAGGYGEAFQKTLHAAWGDVAFPDIMNGVDAVLKLGFVDEQRMAVTGGSYGGYMTAWIVGHTHRFVAAASQRGVYNLVSFYGVTDIPWFLRDLFDVTPMQDVAFLWKHSPLAYADEVQTPLLIIHSENDFRVPISDGEQLFAAIKLRGGDTEFVRFPRDGHELSRSGEPRHRVSRLQHILTWFDKYCM